MGKPSAPTPPDPVETAGAQTGMNIGTALASNAMGAVDEYTPDGSVKYDDKGTYDYKDPLTGKVYKLPQYSKTTTLSDMNQSIYDNNQGAKLSFAETANQQGTFLKDYLGEPANFDTSAIEGRIDELARQRIDPRVERERAALETQLAQQGHAPGSPAWNQAMARHGESKNDAYNQLYLQGRGQAFSELGAMRNQPINEITALLSGSQVSAPQAATANMQGPANTDYAGLVQAGYGNELAAYEAKLAASPWGSLFGAAGKVATAFI